MKKSLTGNLSLKIISIAIAFIIWLVIVNVDNPNMTRTISGIPIELTGTEVITSNDLTYSTDGTPQATIRVRCPRTIVQKLKAADFRATADLSKLYEPTNQVPVTVTCNYPSVSDDQITIITKSLEVTIESINTRRIDVNVAIDGETAEGYMVGEITPSPSVVTVKAPQSVLDQIGGVGITVDVSSLSDDTTQHQALQFYNAGGNVLDITEMPNVEISTTDIAVNVSILNVKNVSVTGSVSGQDKVARGYRYIGFTIEPMTVRISGRRSVIADLGSVSIPDGELSVEGATETISKQLQLGDLLLPEGVSLVDSAEEPITVVMQVEKLGTQSYKLDLSRIAIQNMDEDLRVVNEDVTVNVVIEGLTADLSALDVSEITGTADLSGLSEGSHSVMVTVEVPEGYSVVGQPAVRLQLESRTSAAEENAGVDTTNSAGKTPSVDSGEGLQHSED